MRSFFAIALVAATAASASAQFVTVYSDNFDDGAGSSRWSAPIVDSELGVQDGTVEYAFNYAAAGIPAAPAGGAGIGVRFVANPTDNTPGDEGESIGIIANGVTMPSVDFSLKADVYYRVVPGSEDVATEYVTLGAFTGPVNAPGDASLNDDVPARFGLSNGNGLAWQVTGDGGSATDIFRYEDPNNANTGSQTGLGSLDDIPFGTIPGVTTGGGNPNNPFEQFGFQNRWVTLSIDSVGGALSFKINGVTINSITPPGGTYAGGSILIGLADVFNSAAGQGVYTVFDNVRISVVPEPATGLLAALALAVPARRRR